MNKLKFIALALASVCTLSLSAQVTYKASYFGVKSDGSTLNTRSIQKAIDHISEQGGGTLEFYVGRYLTGTLNLKSNVTIQLHEGAVLVGVTFPYDYTAAGDTKAIICAEGQENIAVTGKGVIQGQGTLLLGNIQTQINKGNLKESVAQASPALISLKNCSNVKIEGINLQNPCGNVMVYSDCKDVTLSNLAVTSRQTANSQGVLFSGCTGFSMTDCYFDTTGDALVSAGTSTNVNISGCKTPNGKQLKAKK